ncbi:MAG: hypothetical protein R3E31_04325 [Chloroflexota bacterium]
MSVREALYHAGIANNRQVEVAWIHSGDLEKGKGWEQFAGLDGIVVPGGFGERGIEGKNYGCALGTRKPGAVSGAVPGNAGDVH